MMVFSLEFTPIVSAPFSTRPLLMFSVVLFACVNGAFSVTAVSVALCPATRLRLSAPDALIVPPMIEAPLYSDTVPR